MNETQLRLLIVDWTKANRCSGPWLISVYQYLLNRGAPADDAIRAMSRFVDEIIEAKAQAHCHLRVVK